MGVQPSCPYEQCRRRLRSFIPQHRYVLPQHWHFGPCSGCGKRRFALVRITLGINALCNFRCQELQRSHKVRYFNCKKLIFCLKRRFFGSKKFIFLFKEFFFRQQEQLFLIQKFILWQQEFFSFLQELILIIKEQFIFVQKLFLR